MNAKTLEAIIKHGKSLLAAFPNAIEKDPVALCKKLRRIETAVSYATTGYCNGTTSESACDDTCEKAKARVCAILYGPNAKSSNRIFINRDPRGFALKLNDSWTRKYNQMSSAKGGRIYTDWGGYGILAPDLNN